MSVVDEDLLQAFRAYYNRLKNSIEDVHSNQTDLNILQRLNDNLSEFAELAQENSSVFQEDEWMTLQESLILMKSDLQILLRHALEESHEGHPTVVESLQTGNRGRPRIIFDPEFLAWAVQHRTQSSLARFLGVGRTTLRNALIEHGIRSHPETPVISEETSISRDSAGETDEILEPQLPIPAQLPDDIHAYVAAHTPQPAQGPSTTFSPLSESELDGLLLCLRRHYRRAGISMLDGMLRRLGHHVQRDRIRASLLRIDPVRRVFECIRIRRRVYNVAGPNALWHHDGQYGLIRWGIVIHGFIDGYSRLIVGLRASDNNSASTVLQVFSDAIQVYGVPSRLRGDHGTENILVAAWMEDHHGHGRGSYIWGRSVHNIQIERLWVDITAQIGASWADNFTILELCHGFNINNSNHIWLLHHLFLPTINSGLAFFAESWNLHKIQIRDGPNRSPADMFGFDMLVHGVRGGVGGENDMISQEELEVYGIDWQGLLDESILHSQQENNPANEGSSSWFGGSGNVPAELNEVWVDSPDIPLTALEIENLNHIVYQWVGAADEDSVVQMWIHGLAFARAMNNMF